MSDRGGTQQVWVARRDQSELRPVTQLPEAAVNVGSWSPDGRSIAFDVTIAANTNIYVASVDGGPARRLTDGPAIEMDPEWSHDGRWILLRLERNRTVGDLEDVGGWPHASEADVGRRLRPSTSPRTASSSISSSCHAGAAWRAEAHSPESRPRAAPPRKSIQPSSREPGRLLATVSCFSPRGRTPTSMTSRTPWPRTDVAHQRVQQLGSLPFRIAPFFANRFLTVSPDGRWLLAPHMDRWDRDIFVLDNYR